MKECRKCSVNKPKSEFYADSHYADKLKADCKTCYTAENVDRMRRNGAETKARKRAWEIANKDACRVHRNNHRAKDRDRHRAQYKAWAAKNRGKVNANHAKRRAALINATPQWADMEKINEVYVRAALMSAAGPIKYHVDHIFPLQGENSCGLHVHYNLQILPAIENIRKHNKIPYEGRMFA